MLTELICVVGLVLVSLAAAATWRVCADILADPDCIRRARERQAKPRLKLTVRAGRPGDQRG